MDGGTGHGLSLPDHGVKTKQGPQGELLFDPVRRKWLRSTPEERVRQHVINHLLIDLKCPPGLIGVEVSLTLNGLAKRADLVVHDRDGRALVIVECKAPSVRVDQRTFEQAARYNSVLRVPFLMVTNGSTHYCCMVDHARGAVEFLPRLPDHAALSAYVRP